MKLNLTFRTILLIYFCHKVSTHGSGAPSSRCESMVPGHWVSPQETLPPYEILIDKTVITPGDRVNITLKTLRGQQGFKGFFIMVKEAPKDGSDFEVEGSNKKAYGMFDLTTSDLKHAQPIHCFNSRNSAMTHVINDVKSSVQLFWIAPKLSSEELRRNAETEKTLRVIATIVKDFWTVWTDIEPSGGAQLLLTDPSQPSPKFFAKPAELEKLNTNNVRSDQEKIPSQAGVPPSIFLESVNIPPPSQPILPLDGESSWNHFNRAWNFVLNIFSANSNNS